MLKKGFEVVTEHEPNEEMVEKVYEIISGHSAADVFDSVGEALMKFARLELPALDFAFRWERGDAVMTITLNQHPDSLTR